MLPSKEFMERVRLAFGLLVGGLLFALLVAAVVFPATIADQIRFRLKEAKIDVPKVTVMGVEIQNVEPVIQDLQTKASIAHSEIARLEKENDVLRGKLKGAGVVLQTDTEPRPDVTLLSGLDSAVRNAEETLRAISDAEPATAKVEGNRAWIVVLGADRSFASAAFELEKVKRDGYDGGILLVDSFYRTVAFFGTKAAASEKLRPLAVLMGREGYVREFNAWCPGAVNTDTSDLIQCS